MGNMLLNGVPSRPTRGIGGHTAPNKGATDSWITPRIIVESLGQFDLDPCQCTPQPWPCAKVGYTIDQNGLANPWFGRVWLNPPYSDAWTWMSRLASHGSGTALIFARTETAGFVRNVWKRAMAIMFLHGRLSFHLPDGTKASGNSGGPSCLVAYGKIDSDALSRSGLDGTFLRLNPDPSQRSLHIRNAMTEAARIEGEYPGSGVTWRDLAGDWRDAKIAPQGPENSSDASGGDPGVSSGA